MNNKRLAELVIEAQKNYHQMIKVGDRADEILVRLEVMYAVTLKHFHSKHNLEQKILKLTRKRIEYFLNILDEICEVDNEERNS